MTTAVAKTELKPLEVRTLIISFILVGIAVAVTVSYQLNIPLSINGWSGSSASPLLEWH